MAKGTVYDCERAIMRDPRSGLRIVRLTHSGCIASNLYFEMCSFTEDEQYVVLLAQRYAGRDAPWDLMRASTDGRELVQLTDADDLHGIVVSPEADAVFYQTGGELRRINLHSLAEDAVARMPGSRPVHPRALAAVDYAGRRYFANCLDERGRALVVRVDVPDGKTAVIHESERQNHITVDASGSVVGLNDWQDERLVPCFVDAEGKQLRPQPFTLFAHNTWFGTSRRLQGTLLPEGQAIVTIGEDEAEPKVIASGRYYWHSSADRAGDWIVSDTNWPQEGLYLVHVATGVTSYVCDPRSSCSHPQWTHPHPSLSPRLHYVLFNSDLTGIGQIYLAELTDEFIAQAAQGYVCGPPDMPGA